MSEKSSEKMDQMLDNIYRIMPLLHRVLRVDNQKHSLMSSDFKTMGILMRHGPQPMSKIGSWLGISKPNMTSVIDRLISEGWVERRQDLEDRRIIEVSLTSKGNMYMEGLWKEAKESARTKLSKLTEEERGTLYSSIERIRVILSKLDEMKKQ